MSVYTSVARIELDKLLLNYNIGELAEYSGISEGIENTNYFVTTSEGHFVLTLFESLRSEQLPFYVELMAFLNEHDVPSAHPVADRSGNYLQTLSGKPAIVMQRLRGKSELVPQSSHCHAIGLALAGLHIVGLGFTGKHENLRGHQWCLQTGIKLLHLLEDDDARILEEELRLQAMQDYDDLPRGVIHADLFRDNVLFEGGKLTGILDFYNACNDSLLYDVAITVNDWCVNPDGSLDVSRAHALCRAYQTLRSITHQELNVWPMLMRVAALRFWLSRLWDKHFPKPGEMTFQKDPLEFRHILSARIAETHQLHALWN